MFVMIRYPMQYDAGVPLGHVRTLVYVDILHDRAILYDSRYLCIGIAYYTTAEMKLNLVLGPTKLSEFGITKSSKR